MCMFSHCELSKMICLCIMYVSECNGVRIQGEFLRYVYTSEWKGVKLILSFLLHFDFNTKDFTLWKQLLKIIIVDSV